MGKGRGKGQTHKNTKHTTGSSNKRVGRIVSSVRRPNQISQPTKTAAATTPPTSGPRIAPLVHEKEAPPSCRAKTRGIAQDMESRQPTGSIRRSNVRSNFGRSNAGMDEPRIRIAVKFIGALDKSA